MFGVDGLKRVMVRMRFHVPSIDVLVESLSSPNTMSNISHSMLEYRHSVSVSDLLTNAMVSSSAAPSPLCEASTWMTSGFVLS